METRRYERVRTNYEGCTNVLITARHVEACAKYNIVNASLADAYAKHVVVCASLADACAKHVDVNARHV